MTAPLVFIGSLARLRIVYFYFKQIKSTVSLWHVTHIDISE